jgi:hypothetical protein
MPDNAVYYHAAYIAAAVVYGGYVISLLVRTRRARDRERRRRGAGGVARD